MIGSILKKLISPGPTILCVVMIYLVSCGTFNITGIAVTGALSAVHRMMLDASRTATSLPEFGRHSFSYRYSSQAVGASLL